LNPQIRFQTLHRLYNKVFRARICQQSVYGRAKSECLLHFSHTTHRTELLFIVGFFLVFLFDRKNSSLFDEFVCKLGLSWHAWTIKGPRVPKKAQLTHERVEYNVFLFDEPLKGSKSLKTFKISLTFRFDKL
jgi:hypothetical protein